MKLSPIGVSAATDAVCSLLNGGTIRLFDERHVLLATLAFQRTAFRPAIDGLAQSFPLSSEMNAPNTGHAAYFDACDSLGIVIWSGNIGTSDADMIIDDTSIMAGARVDVEALTFSFPAG